MAELMFHWLRGSFPTNDHFPPLDVVEEIAVQAKVGEEKKGTVGAGNILQARDPLPQSRTDTWKELREKERGPNSTNSPREDSLPSRQQRVSSFSHTPCVLSMGVQCICVPGEKIFLSGEAYAYKYISRHIWYHYSKFRASPAVDRVGPASSPK